MIETILIFDEFRMLALNPEQHAALLSLGASVADACIVVAQPSQADQGVVCQMQAIEEFCTRLGLACESRREDQTCMVILAESNDAKAMTVASMLLGSFLILRRGLSVSAVSKAFQDAGLSDRFAPLSASEDEHGVTVHDCWRALGHAMRLGWLVPPSSDDEPTLDVDELVHYARPANGGVQIVVPGALVFFPTPCDSVPDGMEWADSVSADGSAVRRFSARYYASLLADLGVAAAACLGRTSAASARALAARGLGPADFPAPRTPGPGALLPALDRLLTLVRGAPGAVAVHGDSICGWSRTALGTLAMAVLMSRFGFSGGEAAAWVHMVACY